MQAQINTEALLDELRPDNEFNFVSDPIENCENECWLLVQWGAFERRTPLVAGFGRGGGGVQIMIDELQWDDVNSVIQSIGGHYRHVLKEWYVKSNVDVKDMIEAAVRCFANEWRIQDLDREWY